ncbi:hypothetical protein C8Q77DRAFT_483697 [Trametes polyzona]|nr:hypothetical protein C8Q77DRAFT_483697 [Trametes polyzona]
MWVPGDGEQAGGMRYHAESMARAVTANSFVYRRGNVSCILMRMDMSHAIPCQFEGRGDDCPTASCRTPRREQCVRAVHDSATCPSNLMSRLPDVRDTAAALGGVQNSSEYGHGVHGSFGHTGEQRHAGRVPRTSVAVARASFGVVHLGDAATMPPRKPSQGPHVDRQCLGAEAGAAVARASLVYVILCPGEVHPALESATHRDRPLARRASVLDRGLRLHSAAACPVAVASLHPPAAAACRSSRPPPTWVSSQSRHCSCALAAGTERHRKSVLRLCAGIALCRPRDPTSSTPVNRKRTR